MDCSMPGLPVLHRLLEFAQTHVQLHWTGTESYYILHITGDSKEITFCLDVFMTQQRAWECGRQGPGELQGSVLRDKRKQDDSLIQQNTLRVISRAPCLLQPRLLFQEQTGAVHYSQVSIFMSPGDPLGTEGCRHWKGQSLPVTHASSQQNSCSARLKVGFGGMGAVTHTGYHQEDQRRERESLKVGSQVLIREEFTSLFPLYPDRSGEIPSPCCG